MVGHAPPAAKPFGGWSIIGRARSDESGPAFDGEERQGESNQSRVRERSGSACVRGEIEPGRAGWRLAIRGEGG